MLYIHDCPYLYGHFQCARQDICRKTDGDSHFGNTLRYAHSHFLLDSFITTGS